MENGDMGAAFLNAIKLKLAEKDQMLDQANRRLAAANKRIDELLKHKHTERVIFLSCVAVVLAIYFELCGSTVSGWFSRHPPCDCTTAASPGDDVMPDTAHIIPENFVEKMDVVRTVDTKLGALAKKPDILSLTASASRIAVADLQYERLKLYSTEGQFIRHSESLPSHQRALSVDYIPKMQRFVLITRALRVYLLSDTGDLDREIFVGNDVTPFLVSHSINQIVFVQKKTKGVVVHRYNPQVQKVATFAADYDVKDAAALSDAGVALMTLKELIKVNGKGKVRWRLPGAHYQAVTSTWLAEHIIFVDNDQVMIMPVNGKSKEVLTFGNGIKDIATDKQGLLYLAQRDGTIVVKLLPEMYR